MIALLAKTRHGVIYDFYFFGHRWTHYYILLSATRLCKITGYDLQLHLRYRIAFGIKKNTVTSRYPRVFTGSDTEDEPNFPRGNNLILQINSRFWKAKILNSRFWKAKILNSRFWKTKILNPKFWKAKIPNSRFWKEEILDHTKYRYEIRNILL